jgi:CCR4-NOT transcription complex subunit 6
MDAQHFSKNPSESNLLFDHASFLILALRYQLIEKQLVEFSSVAMQRADFKKTDDMFNRVLGKDHIAVVCLLENRETGSRLILANTHILWDPQFRDVKLVQTALLVGELERIANSFSRLPPRLAQPGQRPAPTYTDGSQIPLIVCIDSNSAPVSGVYEFLSTGTVPPDHEDFMGHTYGRYTSDGLRHRLGLKSAYSQIGELPMTNHTASFRGTIDYIFYTTQNLAVNAVLGEVDKGYLEKVVGFPNAHFPSE